MPPAKIKEYSCYAPGSLVACDKDLYSSSPIDGDAGDEPGRVSRGTVGIIMNGPKPGYEHHYQVQFLKNITWWVLANEIRPYI